MYLLGFAIGWWLLTNLSKYRGLRLSREQRWVVLTWVMAGVIVGGRLGYALLYEPFYFLSNPEQIFSLSGGGMAWHGGLIGVVAAVWLVTRYEKIAALGLADVLVVPAALGLALGRVGNFLNEELYVTTTGVLLVVGINLLIAMVCYWQLRFSSWKEVGSTSAMFLILYGIGRFISEYLREPEWLLVDVGLVELTRGQIYTLVVFGLGLILLYSVRSGNIGQKI